ncbi:MAG: hydrolase [Gammaproteobacteria bacterium RIFCSPLOWO2_02_FULL_47_50]|nr:MAG: hydrolase [Gammaproteobacteria bacterium RIFCSPLOWO2_12_47_11]OGT79503.1 MAG: hydrolase [Gammaproteobacteria bacterium RIFCSPLOWO2_02_FULL_47_50]OGT84739.1 MAG: hydrolase [Gammaproteobacteria bacterium RIFCSPLOWO2_12_FULL_47_76]
MISGVLLDLSGVLYVGNKPLPGAIQAVQQLADAGLPLRYITNTTRKTSDSILKQLADMQIHIRPDELFTAPIAAKDYLRKNNLIPYLLIHPNLEPEFAEYKQNSEINTVLVGDAGDGFTYDKMNAAFRYIRAGATFLALGVNRYFRDGEQFSLDAGPFVQALEFATGQQATVIGKPAVEFYMSAVNAMHCKPEEVVMVGDDVEADVIGAVNAGLQGILVRTGKYTKGDEERLDKNTHSEANIFAAVEYILKNC